MSGTRYVSYPKYEYVSSVAGSTRYVLLWRLAKSWQGSSHTQLQTLCQVPGRALGQEGLYICPSSRACPLVYCRCNENQEPGRLTIIYACLKKRQKPALRIAECKAVQPDRKRVTIGLAHIHRGLLHGVVEGRQPFRVHVIQHLSVDVCIPPTTRRRCNTARGTRLR